MRLKFNRFNREQHIVVFLDDSNLHVAQLHRGLFQWEMIRDVELPLSDRSQDLSDVKNRLADATSTWNIPNNTFVSWVLSPDIIGAVHLPTQSKSEVTSLFPFDLKDIKRSEISKESKKNQTIFWSHIDWINEFNKISQQLGWVCAELFSRAQLFQLTLPKKLRKYNVLLEGDLLEPYLHIYSSTGSVLRTTKCSTEQRNHINKIIRIEIDSICGTIDSEIADLNFYTLNSALPEHELSQFGFRVEVLPSVPMRSLIVNLLRSDSEGIEIRSTYDSVIKRINALTLVIAVIGIGILGGMVWHDGKLKQDLELSRSQLRKETPVFLNAQSLRLEVLNMSKALEIKQEIVKKPSSFKPLADVLSVLNPPATLLLYAQSGESLKISGIHGDAKNIKSLLEKNSHFYNVVITLPREFKRQINGEFSLDFMWRSSGINSPKDITQEVGK